MSLPPKTRLSNYVVASFNGLKVSLQSCPWGAWSLVALYLSLFSGIIVGLQYDYTTPSYSSSSLDIIIPFGRYWRSLHFYSSQLFFFFCCFHLIFVYGKSDNYNLLNWIRLTATLPIILLLLFTGYILRADNTGFSAGMIAENIMLTIPVFGKVIDNMFFSLSEAGMKKVYVHHIITFDLILLMLAWTHLRTYRVKLRDHLLIAGLILLFGVFVSAPFDPEKLGTTYISGPWFFLGLQELLRYLHPLLAGVVIPGVSLFLLFAIHPQSDKKRTSLRLLAGYLIVYAGISVVAWLR